MSQFSLDAMTPIVVKNVNVRSELHGDEHVPAVDILFRLTTGNGILSALDSALRGMVYRPKRKGEANAQAELEGVEPASEMPVLRCSILDTLKLKSEYAGYLLTIDRGLGRAKSNIVIGECGVDKFRAECQEGGTVELTFRVQASRLDADVLGKLATLIGNEVSVTLTAPAVSQAEVDDDPGDPNPFGSTDPAEGALAGQKPKRARGKKVVQEAGDAFAEAHATAH